MSDPAAIRERIVALVNASPVPADAEARLEALLSELPDLDREVEAADWHEALFMARQAADFDPAAPRIELNL